MVARRAEPCCFVILRFSSILGNELYLVHWVFVLFDHHGGRSARHGIGRVGDIPHGRSRPTNCWKTPGNKCLVVRGNEFKGDFTGLRMSPRCRKFRCLGSRKVNGGVNAHRKDHRLMESPVAHGTNSLVLRGIGRSLLFFGQLRRQAETRPLGTASPHSRILALALVRAEGETP
jgi:hypothetical protein